MGTERLSVRDRLQAELEAAMKARDRLAIRPLRDALAAIDNRGAVPAPGPPAQESRSPFAGSVPGVGAAEAPRRMVSEREALAILAAEITERRRAAALYGRLGQPDRASLLRAEADVLKRISDQSPA